MGSRASTSCLARPNHVLSWRTVRSRYCIFFLWVKNFQILCHNVTTSSSQHQPPLRRRQPTQRQWMTWDMQCGPRHVVCHDVGLWYVSFSFHLYIQLLTMLILVFSYYSTTAMTTTNTKATDDVGHAVWPKTCQTTCLGPLVRFLHLFCLFYN